MKLSKIFFCEIFLSLFLTLIISFQFSVNTMHPWTDSSVFIYIGQQMHEGLLPYRDLFDHKGILLYFYEYLGTFLPYRWGIAILEFINMWIFLLIGLSVSKKFLNTLLERFAAVCFVAIIFGVGVYQGGNLTEEYAMPWIMLALYIFLSYYEHRYFRKNQLVFLGIGFASITLLRPNMIGVWVAFIPLIVWDLYKRGEIKSLKKCFGFGFLGCLIIYVPFIFYFVITGTFTDMLNCYWYFNIEYTQSAYGINLGDKIQNRELISKLRYLIPYIIKNIIILIKYLGKCILVFIPLFWFYRRERLFWLNIWGIVVSILFMSISGRTYGHYVMVLLPSLIIPSCYFIKLFYKIFGKYINVLCICILLYSCRIALPTTPLYGTYILKNADFLKVIPEQENVLMLGNQCWQYLLMNKKNNLKYFYQNPVCVVSDGLYNDFISDFKKKLPKYIYIKDVNERERYEFKSGVIVDSLCFIKKTKKQIENAIKIDEMRVKWFNFWEELGIRKKKLKSTNYVKEVIKLPIDYSHDKILGGRTKEFLSMIKNEYKYELIIKDGIVMYVRSVQ